MHRAFVRDLMYRDVIAHAQELDVSEQKKKKKSLEKLFLQMVHMC